MNQRFKTLWLLTWAFALMALGPSCAVAQDRGAKVFELDERAVAYSINASSPMWIDETGQATAEQALAASRAGQFQIQFPPKPTDLRNGQALWRRVDVRTFANEIWYLQAGTPAIDHISLHWQDRDGRWMSQVAGDKTANAQWPIPDRLPTFAISANLFTQLNGQGQLWVRLQHDRLATFCPLELVSSQNMRDTIQAAHLWFGAFFGGSFFILALCLGFFYLRHDRGFGAMAVSTATIALTQFVWVGLAAKHWFGHHPWLANQLQFTMPEVYAVSSVWTVYVVTQVRRFSARLAWVMRLLFVLALAQVVSHLVWPSRMGFMLANLMFIGSIALSIGLAHWAHRRGERYAKWVLLSGCFIVLGALPALLRNVGLVNTGFATQYGLMIGTAINMLAMTALLIKRNRDLEVSQGRARAMATVDPLTGLDNDWVFMERLHSSLVRCRRYKHQSCLMIVELVNFNWFEKEHGRQSAERALVLAASRLREVVRDVDSSTRVGVSEFALLIEGPIVGANAVNTATKILARCLRPADVLPIGATLKIRIGMALLPDEPNAPLIEESERGLSPSQQVDWLRAQTEVLAEGSKKQIFSVNFY
jgi:two-component system, sensor histidine kinase LadS